LWLPLAKQGNAEAQVLLGMMYSNGTGVPQDDKEAVKWYRLSAEQEYELAQFNLGLMYAQGTGVPQDDVSAHMWLNLCGSNGYKDAVKNRDIIEKDMSPSQIEKAQEMARNWKPTKK
jgi:TPR repeat protein